MGVNCCQGQGRNKVRAIDIAEQGFLVASESPKVLVNGFKILGPILWIHDRQGGGVSMGRLHLSLVRVRLNNPRAFCIQRSATLIAVIRLTPLPRLQKIQTLRLQSAVAVLFVVF